MASATQDSVLTNYALEGPKWASSVVTWSFAPAGTAGFTGAIGAGYQAAIRTAAAQWNSVANVSLQEVAAGTPGTGIVVGWGSFSGGQIGQTDYAYSAASTPLFQPGMTIRIEDPSLLALGTAAGSTYQGTATTLAQVALHEFGHALGLGLSTDPTAVMNIRLGPSNTAIGASDQAGVAALYGAKPSVPTMAATTAGSDTVSLSGNGMAVYRFFDNANGTQFLTSSVSEMNSIFATRSDLKFEGLCLAGIMPGTVDPNATPVYRFFDSQNGSHFFTANAAEANTLASTRHDLVAEGSNFFEHSVQETGDIPVYRFFDGRAGTHFFTSSGAERASIVATRPDMTFEGIAFYAPSAS